METNEFVYHHRRLSRRAIFTRRLIVLCLVLSSVITWSHSTYAITLEKVVDGLVAPVAIAHSGDGRIFVVEQEGRILIVREDKLLTTPFLNITQRVGWGGERGLLGVAFHPSYSHSGAHGAGLFWVNYTDRSGDTVIARYSVNEKDPNRADPASEKVLLKIRQPYANHNGGQLAFGPPDGKDGKRFLYIGTGDGGHGGDPHNHTQNDNGLLGKMLRIEPRVEADAQPPYFSVPADNPAAAESRSRGAIWAKGLRNPWRFSFDPITEDPYIADVGQNLWEEINRVSAHSAGLNYGWRLMEGKHCFEPARNCKQDGLIMPVYEYRNNGARCAVIGGYVYRGKRLTKLQGSYVYGDFCSGEIFGFRPQ